MADARPHPPAAAPSLGAPLLRPLPLLGAALLTVNVFYWRPAHPGWLSGKLSDLGLLLLLPALLVASAELLLSLAARLRGRPAQPLAARGRAGLCGLAVVYFVLLQLWPAFSGVHAALLDFVTGPWGPTSFPNTPDPSDLLVLPAAGLATADLLGWRAGRRTGLAAVALGVVLGAGAATGAATATGAETATATGAETATATGAGAETATATATGAGAATATATATGAGAETATGAGAATATATETGAETATATGAGAETATGVPVWVEEFTGPLRGWVSPNERSPAEVASVYRVGARPARLHARHDGAGAVGAVHYGRAWPGEAPRLKDACRLRWRWRVGRHPRVGEDAWQDLAASVYVVFVPPSLLRGGRGFKFGWTARPARSGGRQRGIVQVALRADVAGAEWRQEEVDLCALYARYYGGVDGVRVRYVGVMTDGDGSDSVAEGDYAGFSLAR